MLVDDLFPQDRTLAEVSLRRGDQTFTDPRTGQPYDIDMPVTPAAPKPRYRMVGGRPTLITPVQTPAQSQPLKFGGETYRRGPKGWEDSRGRPADTNTARILDRAQAQATKSP